MADKYINEVGLQAIKTWIEGKFALDDDLDTLSDRVDEIVAEGGEPNTIETVKVNGAALTPDANKAVDVTVPTTASQISLNDDWASDYDISNVQDGLDHVVNSLQNFLPNETTVILYKGEIANKASIPTRDFNSQWYMYHAISEDVYVIENGDGTVLEIAGGKIDKIKVNGTEQTISNKEVDITVPTAVSDLTNDSGYQTASDVSSAISTAVASAYIYKGSVATVASLPASDNTTGDVYDVQETGMNYAWNGSAWDALGQLIDTSVLWTSTSGQTNSLIAMTNAEVMAILEPSA